MDYLRLSNAAREIRSRDIRSGNVFIFQVMQTSEYIELDIQYRGSSYREYDLDAVINAAGRIADKYGVRMKWGIMQAY